MAALPRLPAEDAIVSNPPPDSPPSADAKLLRAIWNEYVEMPGLRLTCQQAQRLWAIDAHTCASLLDSLVDLKFLVRGADGKYARLATSAAVAAPLRMAKADVKAPQPAPALQHAR